MIQENRIQNRINDLGCTREMFCHLIGISPNKWARALNGLLTLPAPEILRLSKTVEDLESIQCETAPLPLNFKDVVAVEKILEMRKLGLRWTSAVGQIEPETVKQ